MKIYTRIVSDGIVAHWKYFSKIIDDVDIAGRSSARICRALTFALAKLSCYCFEFFFHVVSGCQLLMQFASAAISLQRSTVDKVMQLHDHEYVLQICGVCANLALFSWIAH